MVGICLCCGGFTLRDSGRNLKRLQTRLRMHILGPLTGGPKCHMTNLRNGNVNCHYFFNFHVDFQKVSCHMLNLRNDLCRVGNIFCHIDRLYVAYPL